MQPEAEYRYERKFFIRECSLQEVECLVRNHPALFCEIYHARHVNNIYLDSPHLKNFFANVDGHAARMKMRIRWYGSLCGMVRRPVLELKIKTGSLGRKEIFPLSPFCFRQKIASCDLRDVLLRSDLPEIVREEMRSMHPVLVNQYKRKYFQTPDKSYRMTIDTDQQFHKFHPLSNTFTCGSRDDAVVLELKYPRKMDEDASAISGFFPFRLTKSSKYIMGVEKLYFHP